MWTSRASGRPSALSITAWKAAGVGAAALEAQAEAEAFEESRQVGDARGVGRLVHAMDGRDAAARQLARDGLVRGQHALLDEPVRDVALGAHDLLGAAAQVEEDLGLGQVEIDGAASAAAGEEGGGEALGMLERLQQAAERSAARRVALDEGLLHLGVREPRARCG